ncbi:MAG: serine/threonine-protein phosphatase, partial [Bacteroidetes bacterium]|nr:serine/threonine-protein phosphatase [Bacteroidota bacterium]
RSRCDQVFLSDGITEAMNADGELFGVDRLKPVLLEGRSLPMESLADSVFRAVHGHVKDAPQSDDITLLLMRRTA